MHLFSFFTALLALMMNNSWAAYPKPWQIGFQEAASPIMEHIASLHHLLMIIAVVISVLVAGLLAYVIYRFRASKNPIPSTTSHYPVIEVIWTILPVLILVIIAIPSMKLIFQMEKAQDSTIT